MKQAKLWDAASLLKASSSAFEAASFSEIGNSAHKTLLHPLAVAIFESDSALSFCCFATSPVVTDLVAGLINGPGWAGFNSVDLISALTSFALKGGTSGVGTSEAFFEGVIGKVSFDTTFPDGQGFSAVVSFFMALTGYTIILHVGIVLGVSIVLR